MSGVSWSEGFTRAATFSAVHQSAMKYLDHSLSQRCAKRFSTTSEPALFDVDCNLTHPDLRENIAALLQSASSRAGVRQWLVPGSTIEDSQEAIKLSSAYPRQIFATAGIHPFTVASEASKRSVESATNKLEELADQVVAFGECGLDFSTGFPDHDLQVQWFQPQVELACRYKKPLFLHERLAHAPFMQVLNKYKDSLPPVLVHCFTGTAQELQTYIECGFYVSFSGLLCREESGAALRDAIRQSNVPLDRVMIETDAPYLGFPGCRKNELVGTESAKERKKIEKAVYPNVPSALGQVLETVAQELGVEKRQLAQASRENALQFLQIVD